jgi:membrane carboxypeptidase/penicillin-binding protein
MGERISGARAALPIWIDFMQVYLEGAPDRPFPVPEGVVARQICTETGLLAREGCREKRREVFIEGTEPLRPCEKHGGDRVPQDQDDSEEPEEAAGTSPAVPWTRLCSSQRADSP